MSSVFSGYPIETKPPKPRKDMRRPGDSVFGETNVFQFKLYRDVNGAGAPSITFAIGDNVSLTNPQEIHSALGYLLGYARENAINLTAPTGSDRQAYVASLPLGSVKSQVTVIALPLNNTAQETDLDQGAVNLVVYLFGPDSPQYFSFGAGVFMTSGKRLIELAREMNYSTAGQPRRLDPSVDDEEVIDGGIATFLAPSWDTTPPQETPDILEWVVNLQPFSPSQNGAVPLIINPVDPTMDGNLYQVRAGYIKPGGTVPDSWRHSDAGLLTVT